jgi:RimJ/RimL family protein N-acetyltransferase
VTETEIGDLRGYRAEAVLKDGTPVAIRVVTPADRHLLAGLFAQLSPRSIYLRFFRAKRWLTEAELSLFTDMDFERQVGLAVIPALSSVEQIIAVGRYTVFPDSEPRCAEVNFVVADVFQSRGIGTALLKHLATIGRKRGIVVFEAFVLPGNVPMMSVFQNSGFPVSSEVEAGVIHVKFPITGE